MAGTTTTSRRGQGVGSEADGMALNDDTAGDLLAAKIGDSTGVAIAASA